jgi:hypothetical protein
VSCRPCSTLSSSVSGRVEFQLGEGQLPGLPAAARAPDQRPHAGLKLADVVGLDEIVVRANVQSFDPIGHRVARGQHEDRGTVSGLAECAAHLKAIDSGHPDIQHDHVGLFGADPGQALVAVLGQHHLVAAQQQGAAQRSPHRVIVFHYQDPHLRHAPLPPPRIPGTAKTRLREQ